MLQEFGDRRPRQGSLRFQVLAAGALALSVASMLLALVGAMVLLLR